MSKFPGFPICTNYLYSQRETIINNVTGRIRTGKDQKTLFRSHDSFDLANFLYMLFAQIIVHMWDFFPQTTYFWYLIQFINWSFGPILYQVSWDGTRCKSEHNVVMMYKINQKTPQFRALSIWFSQFKSVVHIWHLTLAQIFLCLYRHWREKRYMKAYLSTFIPPSHQWRIVYLNSFTQFCFEIP